VFEISNFSVSSVFCRGLLFLFPNTVPTDPFENPTFYGISLSKDLLLREGGTTVNSLLIKAIYKVMENYFL
jgi:hypothetical protein